MTHNWLIASWTPLLDDPASACSRQDRTSLRLAFTTAIKSMPAVCFDGSVPATARSTKSPNGVMGSVGSTLLQDRFRNQATPLQTREKRHHVRRNGARHRNVGTSNYQFWHEVVERDKTRLELKGEEICPLGRRRGEERVRRQWVLVSES